MSDQKLLRGVYVGVMPTVLACGLPVAPGDTVIVDSAGEDAHLASQLASVSVVEKPRPARVKRERAQQEKKS